MRSKKLTTGKVYNDYDQIIERVERWINEKSPNVWNCDGGDVKARLAQRIVELSCDAYAELVATRVDQLGQALPCSPSAIIVGGLKISTDTGAVVVLPRLWIRHIMLFAATWGHLLLLMLIAIFRRSPTCSISATFLMEAGGGYEECDGRLVRFCRQGPITPLRSAKRIIVRASSAALNPTDSSFCYVKHPLAHLITTQLQRWHKVTVVAQHLLVPLVFFRALFASPISVLIARDISYIPVVRWLDQRALIDSIVITTSSFTSQPLWMKGLRDQRFKLHMIWYSQNFIPKVYVGEEERSNLPSARHMRVDVHWVWTEGFKVFLQRLGQASDVNVVGPILWYLPENIQNLGGPPLKVAIFDVTPLPDGHRPFGALKNYYTVSLMQKFVNDVVDVCKKLENVSGKEVLILLKHKRKPKIGHHASGYIEFIDRMISENNNLILLDYEINLFGLLRECVFSVSVPYTSTAYVAAELGKPSIYYDPFGELIPNYEQSEFVNFASSPKELRSLVGAYCNINLNIEPPVVEGG